MGRPIPHRYLKFSLMKGRRRLDARDTAMERRALPSMIIGQVLVCDDGTGLTPSAPDCGLEAAVGRMDAVDWRALMLAEGWLPGSDGGLVQPKDGA